MNTISRQTLRYVLIAAAAIAVPLDAAHAYIGPGLGLGTLAMVLGVIGSVFLAIFAIIWYPFKRLFKKVKHLFQKRQAPKAAREQQPNK
jgi:hypothetical protein